MTQSPDALPDRLRDVEHLEEVMTTPSPAVIATLQQLPGDIIVLGVGGKIGPSLARLAKRAAPAKRVVGVARFSDKDVREKLTRWEIECIAADLLERKEIEALPKLANVVFMGARIPCASKAGCSAIGAYGLSARSNSCSAFTLRLPPTKFPPSLWPSTRRSPTATRRSSTRPTVSTA